MDNARNEDLVVGFLAIGFAVAVQAAKYYRKRLKAAEAQIEDMGNALDKSAELMLDQHLTIGRFNRMCERVKNRVPVQEDVIASEFVVAPWHCAFCGYESMNGVGTHPCPVQPHEAKDLAGDCDGDVCYRENMTGRIIARFP